MDGLILDPPVIRELGQTDYLETLRAMQQFTHTRTSETPDEIWFCEHPPIYTLGKFSDLSHVINPGKIPLIQTDRGGQVTYHGPGQLMLYFLIDLKRRKLGIKTLVSQCEDLVIQVLGSYGLQGEKISTRPGVYVAQQKIASLGFKVKRGCTYHGLALNASLDLSPFLGIHPCGYPDQAVTNLEQVLGQTVSSEDLKSRILRALKKTH